MKRSLESRDETTLVLFDIDGTLTPARKTIDAKMIQMLQDLRTKVVVGVVGGSDFVKQKEQLGEGVLEFVDYSFSENGLIAYHDGKLIHSKGIKDYLGEENLKKFINFTLGYLATLDIPIKRGTFIEFRTGMINISPIGRNCSYEERNEFEKFDKEHKIRETMVSALQSKFPDLNLKYSIGGQISFDVFPQGWDKTYCLQHVKQFKTIHFFGDKTFEGGNDYEIFSSPLVKGHTVTDPNDTCDQVTKIWLS